MDGEHKEIARTNFSTKLHMQKSETMTTRNKRSKMAKNDSAAGGRSGVIIEKADDDNVDNWFDTARSPQQQRGTASSSLEQVKPPRTSTARTKKISRKRTVKTPRKKVSMLLPGAVAASEIVVDSNDVAGKDGEGKMVLTATKAKKYADKLRSRKGGGVMDFTSPSDLSRVSTAPLSPDDGEWRKEGSEEMKTPADKEELKSDDVDDSSETENIMLTQEESVDNDNDIVDDAGTSLVENNVDDVAKHQSATATVKENTENIEHPPSSPEDDDFPAGGDQDEEQPEDNDDDLGPPVLPDDYSKEEEEDDDDNDKDKVEKRQFDSKMMDENNYNDDDKNESIDAGINDDDDDDLGFELNMVHDPETPQTVREARAKKEKEKLQNEKNEGKKTKKKTESESDIDADENIDESQFTPKMKKGTKKQKKRKKRNVIFSPKGIPTGNRDYEMVPIGTLIEGSPDEAGPRRSRRAKVKPLEYWRNEKMEYGAHNEDGYMGEVFGNMPVVTGIQKALPTPYKKRKPQVNDRSAVAKKKRRKNFIDDEDEEEEFDSKKLRKRYSYLDGEEVCFFNE